MNTISLKFNSEQEAISLLPQFRGLDDNGEPFWITDSPEHLLKPLGVIHKPTGHMLEIEGVETPELAPLPGWHMDFLGELPEGLEPYVVTPTNKVHDFAR